MNLRPFSTNTVTFWQKGALVITVLLLVFSLIFIGTKGLSRGAAIMSVIGAFWVMYGLAFSHARLPKTLIFPFAFYVMMAISGLFLSDYPWQYLGNVTTVWVGAICIAFFVANGITLEVVIGVFILNFLLNMAAIALGYDAYFVNKDFDIASIADSEIKRYSGIAGQPNIMIALVITMPFLFFLLREQVSTSIFLLLVGSLVAITIVSGSRSGIVFTAAFTIVGALFLTKGLKFKFFTVVLGIAFMLVTWEVIKDPDRLLLTIEDSPLGELVVVERMIEGLDEATGIDAEEDMRHQLRTQFWKYFYQRPIFGHGPNQFQYVFEGERQLNAHNNLGEVAVNWGSIGLAIYYSMYLVILIGILRSPPHKFKMIFALMFLLLADPFFVVMLRRPMIICLCLLLVLSHPSVIKRRRSKALREH